MTLSFASKDTKYGEVIKSLGRKNTPTYKKAILAVLIFISFEFLLCHPQRLLGI